MPDPIDDPRVQIERLTQQLALTTLLLREAYDALTNPESRVDLRDLTKAIQPFVTPRPQRADDVIDPRD